MPADLDEKNGGAKKGQAKKGSDLSNRSDPFSGSNQMLSNIREGLENRAIDLYEQTKTAPTVTDLLRLEQQLYETWQILNNFPFTIL
jgi:hypothetical protein